MRQPNQIRRHQEKRATYERRHILEAIHLLRPPFADPTLISQHKCNLHHPRRPRRHERIPKHGVHHSAELHYLRMRPHGPARQHDHYGGYQIPFRAAISFSAQPYPQETCAPPYDPHARMLQVVPPPRLAPAVLSKGVHAPPSRDDERVEEFLTPPSTPQPILAHKQQYHKYDPISNEGRAHDIVR